jgi:predicted nuclease of predicted toxin-antitoxin system
MRFPVDMGLAVRVAEWLRDEGAGLQRLSDHEIFALAARERRIIITTDLDFGEILAHSRQASTSVIVFDLYGLAQSGSSSGWQRFWARPVRPFNKMRLSWSRRRATA